MSIKVLSDLGIMLKDMTKGQFDKLPKYAQETITNMGRMIRKLSTEKTQLLGQHPKSNTFIHMEWPEKLYVEDYSRVVFKGRDVEVTVHVTLEGTVRVDMGDGVIAPSGRNCFHILDHNNKQNR
jgi:hypothetical protein